MEAAVVMGVFFFTLRREGWTFGQQLQPTDPIYREGTAACLTGIILMQIVNVFLCRSDKGSILHSLRHNRLIYGGILLELGLILLIDYSPWGQAIFATDSPPLVSWVFVLPFAMGALLAEELRKRLAQLSPGVNPA